MWTIIDTQAKSLFTFFTLTISTDVLKQTMKSIGLSFIARELLWWQGIVWH